MDVRGLPQEVKTTENVWIPMRDGCRLTARMWLPEEAKRNPIPTILEYIPYRKRDWTRMRDARMHTYFAAWGYACVRVDMRGSGDSEGRLEDEYLSLEWEDAEDVLEWLQARSWCNGSIGMIGISWGGFNGLQIAARRPPQLKAVITVASTDDRYADDVHYMGGCLLNNNLSWASVMFSFNSLPPDPAVVGVRWREMWMERLKGNELWVENWMRHQHRGDFWKHGSICEDYEAIQCPVFAVSGWACGYSNAVFRMMEHLKVPRKGLIGPWSHRYPHEGIPGPAIGFLQECLRWWDYWLKGIENGIMDEPMLRTWMQESAEPRTHYEYRPGRWIGEPSWPSPNIHRQAFTFVGSRILNEAPSPDSSVAEEREALTIQSPLSVGLFGGKWYSTGVAPDLPYDQREEDGGSLVFDSMPLEEPMEIMGAPVVEFEMSANKPVAMICVRLSDIAVDDRATRVTYGLLNLCHRKSHEYPEPMQPGKRERIRVALNDVSQAFPAGHRIRIAVSTSYWPMAWPPPEPVRLTIHPSHSRLILPVRPPNEALEQGESEFEAAESAPPPDVEPIEPIHHNWVVTRDLADEASELQVTNDAGVFRLKAIDLEVLNRTKEWYRFRRNDFDSVSGEVRSVRVLARDDWHIETVARTVLTSDKNEFYLHATLDAYENSRRVFSRTWDSTVPRRCL